MDKIVIFGAGTLGKGLAARLRKAADVVVVDNDPGKWGEDVLPPAKLKEMDFDAVYIACAAGLDSIYSQLRDELCVPEKKIRRLYSENILKGEARKTLNRTGFLEAFALHALIHGVTGGVAEVGVFRGDFAGKINRCFPDRTLYLFDTFEGFDERDLEIEATVNENYPSIEKMVDQWDSFKGTGVAIALSKCPYPDMCVIKKGYFPDTFDLVGERFALVSLDTDLYAPIKSGLEIFYPLMSPGGVILVDDYYTLEGVAAAVDEFAEKSGAVMTPIGDYFGVAIIKSN